jgi:small subunit ribosomal protein S21
MPLRRRVYDREPIGLALRSFLKLLERNGLKKELRKRKYDEKPCAVRHRAKLWNLSAIRKGKVPARTSYDRQDRDRSEMPHQSLGNSGTGGGSA